MQTRKASAQELFQIFGANDDQEDLVITIKKINEEEFEKHEKKIDDIIKLHWQSTKERLDKISKWLRRANEELGTAKNDIKNLASDVKELENNILDPNEVLEKLIEWEDRSR